MHISKCASALKCAYCNLHCVVLAVVVFLCCGGGCIYVVVVAVHGGFAVVTQPRIHLEERSPR